MNCEKYLIAAGVPQDLRQQAPGLRRRAPLVLIKFSLISGK